MELIRYAINLHKNTGGNSMKRKSIQIAFVTLLTLLLAVSLVPGTAFAGYVVDSGRCG